MMKLRSIGIIALISTIFMLQGCPTDGNSTVQVSGAADLNVRDNFTQCQIRQNGTTIFVRQDGGLDPFAMALDAGVIYNDVWLDLTVVNADRVTPLTQLEIDIINGTL